MQVNVIITCYNKEEKVRRAIESVKAQTLTGFSCIVIDDGSTDGSTAIVEDAIKDDARFSFVRIENAGVASARNYGISRGDAPYITCLDADDQIHPRFLETCAAGLDGDRLLGIVYTGLAGVTPGGDVLELDWGQCDHHAQFEGKNQVPCCNMFRREAWKRTGGYNQRFAPLGAGAEDAELWLKIFEVGYKAKKVTDELLFIYSLSVGITSRSDYKEVDWIGWHKNKHSFASLKGDKLVDDYKQPTFAIVIPVGPGHEHLIFDALDSIENQTRHDWEVCVVWDTVKDDFYFKRLLEGYPYVKIATNYASKHGAGISRNIGVRETEARHLVFLDADDYLQPRFLEYTFNAMQETGADWVYTDLWSQTFSEKPEKGVRGIKTSRGYELIRESELKDFSAREEFYGGTAAVTALYKRSDFELVGGFDEEFNREDWDFHMRLAMAGKCGTRLPLPLFTYRLHAGYRREYKGKATDAKHSAALKKEDVKRIQALYPLEKLEMACSTCKKKIIPVTGDEMVTMDYAANPQFAQNGMIFTGKVTGAKYILDSFKIRNVHPQDAEVFISIGMFKLTPGQTIVKEEPVTSATQRAVQEEPRDARIARTNAWMEEQSRLARAESEKAISMSEKQAPAKKSKQDVGELSLAKLKTLDSKEPMSPAVAKRLLAEEQAGKNRTTVTKWLSKKI